VGQNFYRVTLKPPLRSEVARRLEAGKVYVRGLGDKCNILIIKVNMLH